MCVIDMHSITGAACSIQPTSVSVNNWMVTQSDIGPHVMEVQCEGQGPCHVDAEGQLGEGLVGDVVRRVAAGVGEVQLLVALGQPPLGPAQVAPASSFFWCLLAHAQTTIYLKFPFPSSTVRCRTEAGLCIAFVRQAMAKNQEEGTAHIQNL